MRLSLSSLLFLPRPFDARWCAPMRAAGFRAVELWCAPPHVDVRDPASAQSLAARIRGEGIEPATVHLPFFQSLDAWHDGETLSVVDESAERREAALCEAELGVEAAQAVGAELVVLHLGRPGDAATPERRSFAEDAIARISGHASARGINVAVENLGSPLTSVEVLCESIEHVGRSLVGVCVDVGNAFKSGEGLPALAKAGRELYHVHLGDLDASGDAHRAPGEGTLAWDAVLGALRELRFDGVGVVEVAARAGAADDAAALHALDSMRPFLALATS